MLGEASGEERRQFRRQEIGEDDVRAFAFYIAGEAEHAAGRNAAQQTRRTGGKVANKAGRQPG